MGTHNWPPTVTTGIFLGMALGEGWGGGLGLVNLWIRRLHSTCRLDLALEEMRAVAGSCVASHEGSDSLKQNRSIVGKERLLLKSGNSPSTAHKLGRESKSIQTIGRVL